MAIVTSDELSDYLNGPTWSPRQQLMIDEVILPGVQQELETYLNRPVEPLHVREARQPDCDGRVWPTVTPVFKVLSIDYAPVGGTPVVPDPYAPTVPMVPQITAVREWDPAGTQMGAPNWLAQQAGTPYILIPGVTWDPSISVTGGYVVVEYIGGYNGYVDSALKLAIMRVAAREVERNYDNSITLRDGAGVATGPSDPRNKGWDPGELAALDRLRRRVVVS